MPTGDLKRLIIGIEDRVWVAAGADVPQIYELTSPRPTLLPEAIDGSAIGDTSPWAVSSVEGRARLVLGSDDGLWIWRESADGTFAPPSRPRGKLPSSEVTSLVALGERLAVGTAAGLCWLDVDDRLDCEGRSQDPHLWQPVYSLTLGNEGRLWVLGQSMQSSEHQHLSSALLGFWHDGRFEAVASSAELGDLNTRLLSNHDFKTRSDFRTSILFDRVGGLYLVDAALIYYLDPSRSRATVLTQGHGLIAAGANSLLRDRGSPYESD